MGIRVGGVFSSFDNNNRSEREFFDLSLDFILKFAAMINFDGEVKNDAADDDDILFECIIG